MDEQVYHGGIAVGLPVSTNELLPSIDCKGHLPLHKLVDILALLPLERILAVTELKSEVYYLRYLNVDEFLLLSREDGRRYCCIIFKPF
jgi:hypothetical protein